MDNGTNSIQNNALASMLAPVPGKVVNAIKQASARTGVNFAYLVQQAGAESSFNPKIKAKTQTRLTNRRKVFMIISPIYWGWARKTSGSKKR